MHSESSGPLISCILPTRDRPGFIIPAIEYFLRQDYAPRELIVVDDGVEPIEAVLPTDRRIRYLRLSRRASLGEKRNLACEEARGTIIAYWNDDDWQASRRLRHQVDTLLRSDADICGIYRQLYYNPRTEQAWVYAIQRDRRSWPSPSSLCYKREYWSRLRFSDVDLGEEVAFLERCDSRKVVLMPDSSLQVSILHPNHSQMNEVGRPGWRTHPVDRVWPLLGADLNCYHALEDSMGLGGYQQTTPDLSRSARVITTFTTAHATDLSLPEFSAYNLGQNLPRMRRWTAPFALLQAQLGSAMSVLSCSLEDDGFRDQLFRLYPHTLYRHVSPSQNGTFTLPAGVPDDGFDRVACMNTLEQLSSAQREALVSELVAKLRPGGLVVFTHDYHFDGNRREPGALGTAWPAMARGEEAAGPGHLSIRELVNLCEHHGLRPRAVEGTQPRSDDPELLRSDPPSPHACIGGVFYKPPLAPSQGKAVVLALLTWNKRDVSIDSVKAYVREARMLRRLGQRPFLCVCDNGSTDGTPEALRALEPLIDVPHRFILNPENRGNCIARNQIIDYMLECGADYLLLMDGDIEIVPFSSFAMLRYLEDCGHRLGCIGADSANQTPHRNQASRSLYSVHDCRVETDNVVAWTQYGMFRREVFEAGVRFDETGPFDGPGWGFEDNDVAFQMDMAGFLLQRFFGMTYLHRDVRSSVRIMKERGIDATALCEQRRLHVIDKWAAEPSINDGPLRHIRAMQFTRL